ncbi:hypothetical protein QBC46DRAFT_433738 [Diplogelasinospora grovesii]|uniref:Uncharacterized protein n=1 Tax=Diplogelasinospora grovesii TaxID=303347 RepID=A0AAN6S8V6_9PEZI|nr:hypothetical protein QBC46DRAFT_433738 [Diplogelasinospora grovesii]
MKHVKNTHNSQPDIEILSSVGQQLKLGSTTRYISVTHEVRISEMDLSLHSMAALLGTQSQVLSLPTRIEVPTNQDANPFIKDLGFAKHLEGYSMAEISYCVERVDLDNTLKAITGYYMKLMLVRIRLALSDEDDVVLAQLNRRHQGVDPATGDKFYWQIGERTLLQSYMSTMGRVLKYMISMSTWHGDRDPRRGESSPGF